MTLQRQTLTDLTKVAAAIENSVGTISDSSENDIVELTIFAIEASDSDGKVGIYAWTQSEADDTTVGSDELSIIGIVNADDIVSGDFQYLA